MSEQFTCPMCPKVLGSKSALTQHVRKDHGGEGGLAELMTKWNDSSPRPGGAWRKDRPLRAAPSGVPSIDYAIGIGGVPRAAIIEIFGPPGSGKTTTALTFSAYAQVRNGMCGYEDAERRFQVSMAELIPDLNLDSLFFSRPRCGEDALNQAKDFIGTGLPDVWTIDSVHGCVPRDMLDKPIGDPASRAALARLMSEGCQVLDSVVAESNCALIFVNHIKTIPGQTYGKDWSKPGGSALDYYASVQLRVQPVAAFFDEHKRKIGHTVKVAVDNSKVAPPFAQATYDLYYRHGKIVKEKDPDHNGLIVQPGIDIGSCWFSVCEQAELITKVGNNWMVTETGENLGSKREVTEMLEGSCELRQTADDLIYGTYARDAQAIAA